VVAEKGGEEVHAKVGGTNFGDFTTDKVCGWRFQHRLFARARSINLSVLSPTVFDLGKVIEALAWTVVHRKIRGAFARRIAKLSLIVFDRPLLPEPFRWISNISKKKSAIYRNKAP
jgi:hypothetical protein